MENYKNELKTETQEILSTLETLPVTDQTVILKNLLLGNTSTSNFSVTELKFMIEFLKFIGTEVTKKGDPYKWLTIIDQTIAWRFSRGIAEDVIPVVVNLYETIKS